MAKTMDCGSVDESSILSFRFLGVANRVDASEGIGLIFE